MMSLRLDNVSFSYGPRPALQKVTLEILPGEVFGLLGPNGAGKTTLLRLLALLERPLDGQVLIDDEPISPASELSLRREIVMVAQRPVLFNTTVLENVKYGLKVRRLPGTEVKERAWWALEVVGLKDLANRWATKLSGGQAQLVSLARALALRPRALLLDEPTRDLDVANTAKVEELIRYCNESLDVTVVVVSHDFTQLQRLANKAALLHEGRITATGSCVEVCESLREMWYESLRAGGGQ